MYQASSNPFEAKAQILVKRRTHCSRAEQTFSVQTDTWQKREITTMREGFQQKEAWKYCDYYIPACVLQFEMDVCHFFVVEKFIFNCVPGTSTFGRGHALPQKIRRDDRNGGKMSTYLRYVRRRNHYQASCFSG